MIYEVLTFHSIQGRLLTDEEVEDATAELVDLEEYSEGFNLVDEIDDSGQMKIAQLLGNKDWASHTMKYVDSTGRLQTR